MYESYLHGRWMDASVAVVVLRVAANFRPAAALRHWQQRQQCL